MYIGVLRETAKGERRVSCTPETVTQFAKLGHTIGVQAGAGNEADIDDAAYRESGAEIVDSASELAAKSQILLGVRMPDANILERMRAGAVLIGMLSPLMQPERMQDVAQRGIAAFSLDLMPRVTRAQSMDVLSATSTVAGYRAVILAAELAKRFFPMLMTAAGTIAPAKVLVLGAGVAGLQAVATARRLGAVVQAFDARPVVREQVESLGAQFLMLPDVQAEGTGGYARAVAAEEEARERAFLARYVSASDVVITTAMVPGSKAPLLIDDAMVASMHPGAVIIDLAAEAGGNCAATVPGERVTSHGVIVYGPTDLPSQMPLPASQLFARNVLTFVRHLFEQGLKAREGEDGGVELPDTADEIVAGTLVTRDGVVVHAGTAARLSAPKTETAQASSY